MSLYNLARQVQSRGRGDDSMLVHMTPGEVQGLQALAMKHGGSLSINPETGLPEAGFLKNILPTVVGGAAMLIPGMQPVGAAMLGGGLGLAMSGGNLKQGILGGLGAWGGASLVGGMMGAGAGALGATATEQAVTQAAAQGVAPGEIAREMAAGTFSTPETALKFTAPPEAATPFEKLSKGYDVTKFGPSYLKQNMFPIGAAVAPALFGSTDQKYGTIKPETGQIRPYTYTQERNPEFGQVPGAPYFTQTYTPGTPYTAKEGGIIALASGGMPSGPVERMSMQDMQSGMYPQGMMDKTEYATPTQRPASMEVIKSDYDVGVNPMTGMQDLNMAGGGIVALADGGAPNVPRVDPIALAQNLGQYTRPAPTPAPAVAAYNQILADRAANEYVTQPPPLATLPGGGERATPEDTRKLINQYYVSQLGRQGEQAGLDYWAKRKAETGESLADISKAIGQSPEGQVFSLYRDVLGRRPDEAGASYWQSQLASGVPLADIRKQFESSAEGKARPTVTAPKPGMGGYTYDQATGTFTKTGPSADLTNLTDQGLIADLVRRIKQYEASQNPGDGSGHGGKAGGLMPNNLKSGGISDLGDYSDGGRLLKGPGDGVSDSIPAQIGARQPARLADGEFVVPARIVSELGNGSTDAGARKLYAMMDRIQKRRKKSIGKDKVAVNSRAESLLPA